MVIEASRLTLFESRYGVRFERRLGAGADGEVHSTDRSSAVKFFYLGRRESYQRERQAYIILAKKKLYEVCGYQIPELAFHDDELLAVEMSIVTPPYLLDFASAYFPEDVPDFPDEVWDQYQEDLRERFEGRWEEAQHVIREFEHLSGLVLLDAHGANLRSA